MIIVCSALLALVFLGMLIAYYMMEKSAKEKELIRQETAEFERKQSMIRDTMVKKEPIADPELEKYNFAFIKQPTLQLEKPTNVT